MSRPDRDFIIDVLKEMISVPTVNPPGRDYERFVKTSAKWLEAAGMETKIYRVPDEVVMKHYGWAEGWPRYVLIARKCSGEGPTFHLSGHYDVVPPGEGWSVTDPFTPKVVDGRLYGRGAVDMKGGLAAIVGAVKSLAESGWPIRGCVEVSMVPDEETGGETGTKWMLDEGLVRPDYAVVTEPSGVSNIWHGNKGNLWFRFVVEGKQAHASSPWEGLNAFEGAVLLAKMVMDEYKPLVESKVSRFDYGDPRAARGVATMGGEVRCGDKINILPGKCSFSVDRRLIIEESVEEARKEVEEFLRMAREKLEPLGYRVGVEYVSWSEPAYTDPDSELINALAEAVEEVVGVRPSRTVCAGGLDTRYFMGAGVQAATYGPGPLDLAHQVDEYVRIDDVVKVSEILVRLAGKLLS